MLQHTLRASRIALGAVLVLVGLVLSLPLVPGPGLLLIFVGLTVLGSEFEWARRWRDRLRDGFNRATGGLMASDEKDRLGDKLRERQKADENRYFAERDRALLERLRQQRAATQATAAPERNRCPRCGEPLTEVEHLGVSVDECPAGHGMWLDQGEFEVLAGHERDSWLGRLFSRPKR